MPAHSDPLRPGQVQTGAAESKKETIKLPLPLPAGAGGKLPPVPPKVALSASAQDPEDHRRDMPPTPKFVNPPTVKLPLLPHAIRISPKVSPAPVPVAQKTSPAPMKESAPVQKGWGTVDGWLGVTAAAVGSLAISASLYTAAALGQLPQALTWAGHGIAALGAAAAVGLSAKLLGLWPGSSTNR